MISYSRQTIDNDDVMAVSNTLVSPLITTGPKVSEFENKLCERVGVQYGVATSSGTAALHAAMYAIGINEGDEVIVPAITFVSAANVVVFQKGVPVFCDVDEDTLLIDLNCIEELITPKTKAIMAMDYGGQVCDYEALSRITNKYNLYLVADACHSLGAMSPIADITAYSFHPLKHITTGEGGMAVTNDETLAKRMRRFRFHGMEDGIMVDLGFNYRITDFQCALGISQLNKLNSFIRRRQEIAAFYSKNFPDEIRLKVNGSHVYHLYVIKTLNRDEVRNRLSNLNIETRVHYIPVYNHLYYQNYPRNCPVADNVSKQIVSLPIHPKLTFTSQKYIIDNVRELV